LPQDKPTRVGYVLKMYPRFSETFIVTEVLAHEAAGLNIDIFSLRTPAEGVFQESLARVRASVKYLPDVSIRAPEFWAQIAAAKSLPRIWETLRDADNEDGLDVFQAAGIAKAAVDRGITHLHAHFGSVATSVARLAAGMAGITYSFTAHAKDIYEQGVDQGALRQKLEDAAGVVTVSDYNLRHLQDTYGSAARNVVRIYNGLDLQEFSYSPATSPGPEILAVGRLVEKKGFDDLIRACALLRRGGTTFKARIVGTGPEERGLRALIEQLGLEDCVEMLGARPRVDVIQFMKSARLVAAPCIVGDDGNRDGLPTVLLEAMALGAPCVATPVTGIPEIIRDGSTGLLVPEKDPTALAEAMKRLLTDRTLAMKVSREGRTLMERDFDIHKNTAVMRDVFARCVSRSSMSPRGMVT
jgi:colanic acid/amylovoran biosynthesis glycosyltransferase